MGHTVEFPQPLPRQVYHHWLVFSAAVREGRGRRREGGRREGRSKGRGKGEGRRNGGKKGKMGESEGEEKEREGRSKQMQKGGRDGWRK